MLIEWQIASVEDWHADAIIFFVFEKADAPLAGFRRYLEGKGSWLSGSAALKDFQAKPNEMAVCYAPSEEKAIPRVILVGLGPADRFESDKLKNAAAHALRKCRELNVARPAIAMTAFEGLPLESPAALRESLFGAVAGLHKFNELKTRNSEAESAPETLFLLSESEPDNPMAEAVNIAESESGGVMLARDLTVSPSNRATPAFLAETARQLAQKYSFKIEVIDLDSAVSMGMGAFAAVARGSREPAFIIIIEHAPPGTENDPPLVFIGKGITFDSGGISLKSPDKLDAMKQDMAGAASVLGAFEAIGRIGLKRRVVGILPCTENMPDGKAYKPGDVLKSFSGQTIEVISTDAEGRVVLCDAIAYAAAKYSPAAIIDIATLTGACIIALGNQVAAVLGNNEELMDSVKQAGWDLGEKFWPLPLWDFYFEALKSEVADMKNVGDRSAGAIIGGIFLKQFVPREVAWVHLDIAGTAWTDKDSGATPRGATGFGVRTLFEIARRWPESQAWGIIE